MNGTILKLCIAGWCLAVVIGCENSPSSFNMEFTNKSKKMIWVESANYGNADVRCGVLIPGASKGLNGPVRPNRVFSDTIEVVWWNGDRDSRPADESQFKRQVVTVTQPILIGSKLQLAIEFGEDEVWRQVIPQDSP